MDINKLPKWAKEIISKKDRDINNLKNYIGALEKSNNKESSVYYCPNYNDAKVYLPEEKSIKFVLGEYQHIYIRKEGNYLIIMGSGRLIINPNASNSINVGVK